MPMPAVGARVLVPLGNRTLTGIVLGSDPGGSGDGVRPRSLDYTLRGGVGPGPAVSAAPAVDPAAPDSAISAKPLVDVLDAEPFLPADVVSLAAWVADYYACGVGEAIATAMPPRAWIESERHAAITDAGEARMLVERGARRDVLELLTGGKVASVAALARKAKSVQAVVARLEADGLITLTRPLKGTADASRTVRVAMLTAQGLDVLSAGEQQAQLGERQQQAIALLRGAPDGLSVRELGRGVLLMVPEIALTPAAAAIFRAAFGDRVAIQHSGLSDGERYDQWQRIRRGDVDLVIGTRSSVFAPIANLGLIIVDEEHDGSYKQEESPRYHGRDVALVRGSQAGALVVLGSATPAMESFHNAQGGRYELLTLSRRVLDRPMAAVRIVDMREEYASA